LFVTTTPVLAAVVTGQNGVVLSIYSNPFDPNNDGVGSGAEATTMTAGAIGAGTVGNAAGYSQADVVNRHDTYADGGGGNGRLIDSTGVATSVSCSSKRPSSFNAGTIIAYQYVLGPFNNANAVHDESLMATTVQSGPGTQGTSPIKVTSLASVQSNVSTMRLEFGMSKYASSTQTYAEMNEVILLPRELKLVPATVTQRRHRVFGAPQAVSDLDGYGWGGFKQPVLETDLCCADARHHVGPRQLRKLRGQLQHQE